MCIYDDVISSSQKTVRGHLLKTIAWRVVRSIDAPVALFEVFQLIPPVLLITMIPISIAGWGVREATMGLAFGYARLMVSEGVNVPLLLTGNGCRVRVSTGPTV